jgi:transposase
VYPNQSQSNQILKWMNTSRYIYNKALAMKKADMTLSWITIRNKIVNAKSRAGIINSEVSDWETETPKDVRAGAVRDMNKAYTTNISELMKGNLSHFNMHFRSKKNRCSSIVVSSYNITEDGKLSVYPRKLIGKAITIASGEKKSVQLLRSIENRKDARLMYDRGRWFFCAPIEVKRRKITSNGNRRLSLDPGKSVFMVGYSPDDGGSVVWSSHNKDRLDALNEQIDALQSEIDDRRKAKQSTRQIRIRMDRLRLREEDLLREMHYQTASYLCGRYNTIYLPSFESQEMVKGRRCGRRFNRGLLQLRHYKFQQQMRWKAEEYENVDVEIVTEPYTSKTCTRCGTEQSSGNGNDRMYKCSDCGLCIHRDIMGARNIMIRELYGDK